MEPSKFSEETWRDWVRLVEPDADISDVPMSVLFKLYPEVLEYGPVASTAADAFVRVRSFLRGVAEVGGFAGFSHDFRFFSFLSLGGLDFVLDRLEVFWFEKSQAGGFTNLGFAQGCWGAMDEADRGEAFSVANWLPSGFYEAGTRMMYLFLLSELYLTLGFVSLSDFSPTALELRRAFLEGELELRLENFRVAVSEATG